MLKFRAGVVSLFFPGSVVLAHPGHGVTEPQTVTHYLIEPNHIGPVLVFMAVLAAGVWGWRRVNSNRSAERVRKS